MKSQPHPHPPPHPAHRPSHRGLLVSRHRSSVGLRWPSKRIAALPRLPIRLGMGCAMRPALRSAGSAQPTTSDPCRATSDFIVPVGAPGCGKPTRCANESCGTPSGKAASHMRKAGIVGLGAMGAGIAQTLRANGYEVHVCDLRPGVATAFAAQGGVACNNPAEVAAACAVVVSVVVNAAQTEAVLFGAGGAA